MKKIIQTLLTHTRCLTPDPRPLIPLIIITVLLILSPFPASAQPNPRTMTFPPLEYQPPGTERVVLENGMILHLLENRELPLINITTFFTAGSIYEPEDKAGLASLTGRLMRTGGTESMSAEEMNEELEFIAASVEVSIGEEEGSASLSVMKKDIDTGLRIFADVFMRPGFDPDKIELEKNRMIESIRRENDSPEEIASREFTKILHKGTPYGVYPTIETVSRITGDDIKKFHNAYLHPNNIMLGISGNFTRDEMVKKIRDVFSTWKKQPLRFPDVPALKETYKKSVNLVDKELTQTVIRMGHRGIKKTNPDYHAVRVMSYILGSGGFNSRLMKEVRSDRGLAYSVWSYFISGYRKPGDFLAGCETKSRSTSEAISVMLKTIKGMRTAPVKDEELSNAKKYLINSFVFAFTSSERVVVNRMNVEFHKLAPDYLETYRDKIDAVTKEDILRVAKKYLHPNGLTMVVVGNKKDFDRPLSEFGEVEVITLD